MENKEKMTDLEYKMTMDGYSQKEIAFLLGISQMQVKKDLKERIKTKKKQTIFINKISAISFN
ncbi:MAG: hypothetical protein PHN72_02240 [Bacilli bacterium]|nr:hypothetical protein [Bacilli bacterium]